MLTAVKVTLQQELWSSGGLLLTAFFVAGWIYRFRREATNRLRTLFAVALGLIVLAHGLMNSGEGERLPSTIAAPLIIIFGVGFFAVLIASSESLQRWPGWAMAGVLVLQGLPLVHDLAEPRRIHFSYPPYYPAFFMTLGREIAVRGGPVGGWMADVPAGAAWYSGQRIWAQPDTLRDFYGVHVMQPMLALVLTPETLDRPFFAELTSADGAASRFGDWGRIYTSLLSSRLPREFPLRDPRRLSENFYLLMDPAWAARQGK
jgi:hypothetical protein